MIAAQDFMPGRFTYKDVDGRDHPVPIDFNPATLEYSITINAQGEGGQTQQAAGVASAKLNLELMFDTTDSGDDVRSKTNEIELMLRPRPPARGTDGPPRSPPSVTFEWGAFKFEGIVDSFKQTMDFFSANGVPLRAAVSLTILQTDYQFDQRAQSGAAGRATVDQALVLPGGSPSQLAADAGDPFAARLIAAANGLESLRASAGAEVSVGGGVSIGAAASFSAGASLGAGAGAGIGIGGAAGIVAGGGPAFSGVVPEAGAAFSATFGGSASAGKTATAGAFGGLHASPVSPGGKYLASERLLAAASASGISSGTLFDVTGKAITPSASAFKAEVGATKRLRFDET